MLRYILLLGSLIPLLVAGQTYHQGYLVIKESGDSLKGNISKGRHLFSFRPNSMAVPLKFRPDEIDAYGFADRHWKYSCFDVIQNSFPERTCGFAERLQRGPVNLYAYDGKGLYSDETYRNYYVEYRGEGLLHLVEDRKGVFRRKMAAFFHRNDSISSGIRDLELRYEDLEQIVQEYNRSESNNQAEK